MRFLLALLFVVSLYAKVLDKVIATVNGLPITTYDVYKTSQKLKLSPNEALKVLIDDKLIRSEIKKRGINVDDFEIENAIDKIAKQNGLDTYEFKNILMQKGEYKTFIKNLRMNLLKRKLFDQIVQTKLHVDDEELSKYYEKHKNEFKIFKTIQVTKYIANNKALLNQVKNNPLFSNGVKSQVVVYNADELPLGLLFMFKQTKVGEFTPIVNEGMNYAMFYVNRKEGETYIPFEKIKALIANKIIAQKREAILKDYFSKLKNTAYIKFYTK